MPRLRYGTNEQGRVSVVSSLRAPRLNRIPPLATHVVGSYPANPDYREEMRVFHNTVSIETLKGETQELLENPVEFFMLNHPAQEKKEMMLEEIMQIAPILRATRTAIEAQICARIDIITDGQTITNMINYVTDRLANVRHHRRPVVLSQPARKFPLLQVDLLCLKALSVVEVSGFVPDWGLAAVALQASTCMRLCPRNLKELEQAVKTISRGLQREIEGMPVGIRSRVPMFKACIAGPYTVSLSVDDRRKGLSQSERVYEFAGLINEELKRVSDLHLADIVQIDEPFLSENWYEDYREVSLKLIDEVALPRAVHICGRIHKSIPEIISLPFDILDHEFASYPEQLDELLKYSFEQGIGLGVVRSDSNRIEQPKEIAEKILYAAEKIDAGRIFPDPDCGLRNLLPASANGKLVNLVEGTKLARKTLIGCKNTDKSNGSGLGSTLKNNEE